PQNYATIRNPPLCRNDLAEMSRLGLDVLRLGLSWSLLEPERGRFNRQYLARIEQVVGWARQEGIRVILDMHQNAYSRYTGRCSATASSTSPGKAFSPSRISKTCSCFLSTDGLSTL